MGKAHFKNVKRKDSLLLSGKINDMCLAFPGAVFFFFISIYLSSLRVADLRDTPRRRLVVTGDSARIQDETTGSSAWFLNVLGV